MPELSLLGRPVPRLARRRGRGLDDVGGSGSRRRSCNLQSLADLGNSLEVVRGMRVVRFGLSLVSAFAMASLLPMAPLLLRQFPLAELLAWLVRAIAGI